MTEENNALAVQVGGNHYKAMKIQPVEFVMINRWDFCASSILKYVLRHANKNGRQDLEKALHFAQLRLALLGLGAEQVCEAIEMRDFITANSVPVEEGDALTALARVVWENSTRAYQELTDAIKHLISIRYPEPTTGELRDALHDYLIG